MADEFNMSDDRRRNQANPKDKANRKVRFQKHDNTGFTAAIPERKDSKVVGVFAEEDPTNDGLMNTEYFDRRPQLEASLNALAAQNQANVKTNATNTIKKQDTPLN